MDSARRVLGASCGLTRLGRERRDSSVTVAAAADTAATTRCRLARGDVEL